MADDNEVTFEEVYYATQQIINDLTEEILGSVSGVLDSGAMAVTGTAESIASSIDALVDTQTVELSSLVGSVKSNLSLTLDSVTGDMAELASNAVSNVDSLLTTASEVVDDTYNSIVGSISSTVDGFAAWIEQTSEELSFDLEGTIEGVSNTANSIIASARTSLESVLNRADRNVSQLSDGISEFIDSTLDVAGETLNSLIATTASIPDSLGNMADRFYESAKDNIASPIEALPGSLIISLIEGLTSGADKQAVDGSAIRDIVSEMANRGGNIDTTPMDSILDAIDGNAVLRFIISVVASPLMLVQVISGVTAINAEKIQQNFAAVNPYKLLSPPDAVDALNKGSIDRATFDDVLSKDGYSKEYRDIIGSIGAVPMPIDFATSQWLRGITSTGEFGVMLKEHGFSDEYISLIKETLFYVPPPGDLITMAVREAFSPETAERFGQYEDFPEAFAEYAAQQGISEEWARRYWAAHWALPSPQMGFEMLHRGIIAESDMILLLKALDVMPYWRDKLIQLSYSPITRVDVRRMHAMGLMDREEVVRAYRDLGYSPRDSDRLATFTEQYNMPSAEDDAIELKTLSRSAVLGMYEDGIITRDSAMTLLVESGYSSDASELYLYSIDVEQERKQRKAIADVVVNRYKAGLITFEAAQDQLYSSGLEDVEIVRIITDLQRAESSKVKLPSKADLDKMLVSEVINKDEYREALELLGYPKVWVDRYIKLIEGATGNGH